MTSLRPLGACPHSPPLTQGTVTQRAGAVRRHRLCSIRRGYAAPQSFEYEPETCRQFENPQSGIEPPQVHDLGEGRRNATRGWCAFLHFLSTKMLASLTLMLREPWARVLPLVFSKALDTTSAHRRTLVVQADKTSSDLIYALTELRSSRGRVSRESFRHIVRNGQPACENSVARQTVFQFSNVGARRDQLGWWDIGRIQKPDVLRSTQLR